MVSKVRLTPEQRKANRKKLSQKQTATYKDIYAEDTGPTGSNTFELKFNSETVASAPRGNSWFGDHIGDGAKWKRPRRYG